MWYEFNTIFNDLDKVLYTLGKSYDSSFGATLGNFPSDSYNVEDDKVVMTFDVPGVAKDNIDVEYNNGILSVKAKRDENKTYSGKWKITHDVDPDKISAKHENGVLTITMFKRESEKGKKIALE
jgi:HSP20 family protein